MTTSVTPKYTLPPARPQAKPAAVRALGRHIDVGLPIPHHVVEWLCDVLLPAMVRVYQANAERRALVERLDEATARRQLEIRENVARCERIGREAAAEVHDRRTRGEHPYAIAREIALRHKLPVGVLLSFMAEARRALRQRRDEARAIEVLELHRAGCSKVEIGRQLGITPQHAGRLLRKAQSQIPGADHG